MKTIELHRIKAKIALKQKLTEYERCYFLLFGKWEEVHKFLKKEKSSQTIKRPYRCQNGNVRGFKPKDRNDKANAFQRDKQ